MNSDQKGSDGTNFLTLNHETPNNNQEMVFCDARFTIAKHHIEYKPFDKAEEMPSLPHLLLRFVHNHPGSIPSSLLSIIVGQLHRLASVLQGQTRLLTHQDISE